MSWLPINPFKSLQLDSPEPGGGGASPPELSPSAGVKDDLSALGHTIGRQLRGVADFLAPPPHTTPPPLPSGEESDSPSQPFIGMRNDIVELGGSVKSLLTTNKAVTGISRFASNLLQFQSDDRDRDRDAEDSDSYDDEDDDYSGDVAGVTDEVIEFVRAVSEMPECWIDFPLEFDNDFHMSGVQIEHASTVEQLVPSFTGLRLEVCNDMNGNQFWKIYFILLLPRLNEHDFKLLITPEIVEARDTLLQKLRNKKNSQEVDSDSSEEPDNVESQKNDVNAADHPVEIEEHVNTQWLEEEADAISASTNAPKQLIENEDINVSFSDLEEDYLDNDTSSRRSSIRRSQDGPNEWVELNKNPVARVGLPKPSGKLTSRDKDSEGEESSDWLTIDGFDSDNLATL